MLDQQLQKPKPKAASSMTIRKQQLRSSGSNHSVFHAAMHQSPPRMENDEMIKTRTLIIAHTKGIHVDILKEPEP
jgi:hypothetical protein